MANLYALTEDDVAFLRDLKRRFGKSGPGLLDEQPGEPTGQFRDVHIVEIPEEGFTGPLKPLECDVMHPILNDDDEIELSGAGFTVPVVALDRAPRVGSTDFKTRAVAIREKFGTWVIAPEMLQAGCLAQDHPGRGTVFNIKLGFWNATSHSYAYRTETVEAIDFRYGVPYPKIGATGLFTPRSSVTYGTIYETVALDCSSPGSTCP